MAEAVTSAGRHEDLANGRSDLPSGGELNAALTSEVVRIHSEFLGRGPRRSFSFHHGDIVITVMEDVMTRAEKHLIEGGHQGVVLEMRQRSQQTMRADLAAAVESLTGREVRAFLSDNSVDPDIAVEIFILDGPGAVADAPPGG